jgi:hypothetical protein
VQLPYDVAVPAFQTEDTGSDPFGPQRWNLVIRAFFDDSGKESDPSNRVVCIAGYLAAGETPWNILGDRWRQILLTHGISWLHMKDFMPDKDEYAALKWDWPKKKAVLEDFIGAIRAAGLIGFGVGIDVDAWRKIPKEITRKEGDAQQFCFARIMRMIVERMKVSAPRDFVSVHFDCDRNFTPARFQRFIGIRDRDPDAKLYLQSFTIADPRVYIPLQAADLLAWESRKDVLRRMGGFESREEYDSIFQILPDYFPTYISELWLESDIEEQILKPIREAQQAKQVPSEGE